MRKLFEVCQKVVKNTFSKQPWGGGVLGLWSVFVYGLFVTPHVINNNQLNFDIKPCAFSNYHKIWMALILSQTLLLSWELSEQECMYAKLLTSYLVQASFRCTIMCRLWCQLNTIKIVRSLNWTKQIGYLF